jgi:hypothetical protein
MRNQPVTGRYLRAAAALTACLLLLPACAEERQLAQAAAAKIFGSLGKQPGEIKLATSQVNTVASKYGASAERVAAVAGNADTYQGWKDPQGIIDRMAAIALDAHDNKAVSAGVGVACDYMAGEIKDSGTFQKSVAAAAAGMTYSQAYAFRAATTDLANKLAKNKAAGSPDDKAAAAWVCYGYSIAPTRSK